MKKIAWIVFLLLSMPSLSHAAYENYHQEADQDSAIEIVGRGLGNAVGLPTELVSTFQREKDLHPKGWVISYWPRMIGNVLMRGASASIRLIIWDTSSGRSGVGVLPMPTKPVTPGVFRTTYHDSSLRIKLTRI